jgi:hypothetical protein
VTARLEGRAPVSTGEAAVLGGANLAAVRTEAGWEVLQYRQAALVGDGVWRLTGLLRGQQGTEREMAAGAAEGALVVLLDPEAGRFRMDVAERGLERIARVGPEGQPPGGSGFTETAFEASRLQARPWSPAGLRVATAEDGVVVAWTPRVRLGGDVWDLEPQEPDPRRFRVRLLDGAVEVGVFETEALSLALSAAELAGAWPGGSGPAARVAVAQYGAGFGWGVEAETRLIV